MHVFLLTYHCIYKYMYVISVHASNFELCVYIHVSSQNIYKQ